MNLDGCVLSTSLCSCLCTRAGVGVIFPRCVCSVLYVQLYVQLYVCAVVVWVAWQRVCIEALCLFGAVTLRFPVTESVCFVVSLSRSM